MPRKHKITPELTIDETVKPEEPVVSTVIPESPTSPNVDNTPFEKVDYGPVTPPQTVPISLLHQMLGEAPRLFGYSVTLAEIEKFRVEESVWRLKLNTLIK